MENNHHPLDPSHELPAGDDDIMAGSIYAGMESWATQQEAEREQQEAADRAAAEQQAIVDAAHEEAAESPRLGSEERAYYRAIARAATASELPEGVPDDVRRSTIGLLSTPAKAAANMNALQEDARNRLRGDRNDRRQEGRDRRAREAAEEAERQAEAKRIREAEEAQRKAEEKAEQEKLQAEADAREAKLAAEHKRVRDEHKANNATSAEEVDARVEREISQKHGELTEQAKGIMRHGLRERFAREAEAEDDAAADKAGDERVAFINANGGADAIDTIRAKEAKDAEDARLAEEARLKQEAEDADRQAFLDRLHGRAQSGFREAKDQQDAQREEARRTPTPAEQFLANADHDQLNALIGADVDNLPEGLDRDLRRTLLPAHVGRAQAQANLDALRGRAQERLNQDADALDALVQRAQNEGVDGLTDEEIAMLPADAMAGMSDEARAAYFDRMHHIRGAQHQAAGRGDRNLVGVQSFAGDASELGGDLAQQRSLFPNQTQGGEQEPSQDELFDEIYGIQDMDEWRRRVDALPEDVRDAFLQYQGERSMREADAAAAASQPPDPVVWPPRQPRPATPPAFPARARRRPLGGADPFAPMPTRANSGIQSGDPSDIAPVNPNPIDNGSRTAWEVVKDWWPGRSLRSFLPNTRPSLLRGGRRRIADGFRALGRSMNTSPEMSDDERAQSEAYIRGMDQRDDEEAAARVTPAARARVSRPRVRQPGERTPTPPSALDNL